MTPRWDHPELFYWYFHLYKVFKSSDHHSLWIHERKFSLVEFAVQCAAIWGSWLGQIVNWWAGPEYRVHQYIISFTLYHLYQPENLMRRLQPWPHPIISRSVLWTGPCLVLSSHSFSNWIKKLLWRTSGPPLASWKLILLTEMSGTGLSWGEQSSQHPQLIWFNLIIIG